MSVAYSHIYISHTLHLKKYAHIDRANFLIPYNNYTHGGRRARRFFQDVKVLAGKLPNVAERRVVPFPEFNHLDFLWANDVKNIVYDDLIGFMKRHDRKYADAGWRPSAEVDANVVHADYVVSDVA